jgi:hypothetical protein
VLILLVAYVAIRRTDIQTPTATPEPASENIGPILVR